MNAVEAWFGDSLGQLHPLLQALHRDGGELLGTVRVNIGSTPLARWLGQRLASKMGLPPLGGHCDLTVRITHGPDSLTWARHFTVQGRTTAMVSTFRPVGGYPGGHWIEHTGPVALSLGVDLIDGGWHWRMNGIRWRGIPLPGALMPRAIAFKRIVDNRYEFVVQFSWPVLGTVLSYHGLLSSRTSGQP